MIKCKYAGDVEDEYCANCNGITFEISSGEEIPCYECTGYEPDKEHNENSSKNISKTVDNTDTSNYIKNDLQKEIDTNTPEIDTNTNTIKGVKVKSICYLSSCTVCKNNNYYKFSAQEEWEITDDTDVEQARKALWEKINNEVDKQIEDIL